MTIEHIKNYLLNQKDLNTAIDNLSEYNIYCIFDEIRKEKFKYLEYIIPFVNTTGILSNEFKQNQFYCYYPDITSYIYTISRRKLVIEPWVICFKNIGDNDLTGITLQFIDREGQLNLPETILKFLFNKDDIKRRLALNLIKTLDPNKKYT